MLPLREYFTMFCICFYIFIVSQTNFFINIKKQREQRSVVALILARGGSKGIKLKNLARINNVTLLAQSIHAIKQSKKFDGVWVSTDHYEIEKEAYEHGALVHPRAAHTATDTASSLTAVMDFLKYHPASVGILGLVQVTSPFLKADYLVRAVDLMTTGKYNSITSVTRQYKLRWKNNSGEMEAANFDPLNRPRRQDWDGELIENGMFYFAKVSAIIKWNSLQPPRVGVVEIPWEDSLEIDSPLDLKLAQFLTQNNSNH